MPARDVPMDGALVYSCDGFSAAVDWLVRRDLPLVFVDQAPVDDRPSVNVDDRAGPGPRRSTCSTSATGGSAS